jgi:hypothetical protein
MSVYVHYVVIKYNQDSSDWERKSHMAMTMHEFLAMDKFLQEPPHGFEVVIPDRVMMVNSQKPPGFAQHIVPGGPLYYPRYIVPYTILYHNFIYCKNL